MVRGLSTPNYVYVYIHYTCLVTRDPTSGELYIIYSVIIIESIPVGYSFSEEKGYDMCTSRACACVG